MRNGGYAPKETTTTKIENKIQESRRDKYTRETKRIRMCRKIAINKMHACSCNAYWPQEKEYFLIHILAVNNIHIASIVKKISFGPIALTFGIHINVFFFLLFSSALTLCSCFFSKYISTVFVFYD